MRSQQQSINEYYNNQVGSQAFAMLLYVDIPGLRDDFFNALNMGMDEKVIELGFGNGVNKERYIPNNFYGVDINEKLLSDVSQYNTFFNFITANGHKLPFKDDTFDVGIMSYALSGMPDSIKGLNELIRVTKSKGRIGILDMEETIDICNKGVCELNLEQSIEEISPYVNILNIKKYRRDIPNRIKNPSNKQAFYILEKK